MVQIRNIRRNTPIYNPMNKLFRNRSLFLLISFCVKPRHVHLRTLTSHKIGDGNCLLTQVDETPIRLINGETGTDSRGLNFDPFGVYNFAGGNCIFKEEVAFGAGIKDDALQFPLDLNRCIFALVAVQ